MTPRARRIILAFALLGLVFAGASAWVHYRILTDPTYVSPCDISQRFSCTQVYLSRFGSIRGVPVALGGVIWFTLVSLLAAFSRPKTEARPAADPSTSSGSSRTKSRDDDATGAYIFALATIGLAVILYLAYASFFVLKTGCVLCIGTYVSVIAIFIVAGGTGTTAMTTLPARLLSDLRSLAANPMMLLVAILFVAGAASVVAFFPKEARPQLPPAPVSDDYRKRFEDAWAAQPRINLGIPAEGAAVVIVKFNDWLCPGCKSAHFAYQPVLDKYAKSNPRAIKYVLKDWPWNKNCNFNTTQTFGGHEAACDAAAAVRMARDVGKADEMIAWIFGNQERFFEMGRSGQGAVAGQEIRARAAQLGVKDFDKEYAAKQADIRRDVADGGALQVRSTPTFFVNGVRANGPDGSILPAEYFDLAIEYELKHAK